MEEKFAWKNPYFQKNLIITPYYFFLFLLLMYNCIREIKKRIEIAHYSLGGKEIGYRAVPDPRRRQEDKDEYINHIIVSLLLQIKLNFNDGYAD